MEPVGVNVSVSGSKISAEAVSPPITSTRPSVSRVADAKCRSSPIAPTGTTSFSRGSKTSAGSSLPPASRTRLSASSVAVPLRMLPISPAGSEVPLAGS